MFKCIFVFICICSFILHSECRKSKKTLEWWQSDVLYQIYPRSFKDNNGDGIGDLRGIYHKLSYIKSLGVGAIWLSPIFTSPMADFGYDIANFREIDPIFGSMDDFDALLRKCRKLGLKVLLDYVPNHTSDEHEWFKKSVKKIAPFTDFYVWKDPKYVNGTRQPPNNWLSCFGKSAWTYHEERGQYYLHQFDPKQPDLDFRNAVVYEEMKNILIFWLDKGVDGFRIDSINHIFEDELFRDEPLSYDPHALPDEYDSLNHIYTKDQPGSINVTKDWRAILDRYSKNGHPRFMMGEAYSSIENVMKFYGTKEQPGAHCPFNFIMINTVGRESDATFVIKMIQTWYDNMPEGAWANWVIGNHDNSRPASRFGHYLIDGLHMLQMLLPGTAVVYNGDELGMEDPYIRWDQSVDPKALIAGPLRYRSITRDPARTPFQWDDTENAGFTKSLHTWLPVNPNYWNVNVKLEAEKGKLTHLRIFKDLVKLRKNIVFQRGDLHLYVLSKWVLAIVRTFQDHATYAVVVNFGSEISISNLQKQRPSLPEKMNVVIPSVNSNHKKCDLVDSSAILLRPKAALVLTTSEEDWENDFST